jgi:hypothetical protein
VKKRLNDKSEDCYSGVLNLCGNNMQEAKNEKYSNKRNNYK